jgi:hypothetical protein
MADNSGSPPGWYPDNQGNQRYWDGSAWTEHVQGANPSGFTAANAPQAQPATEAQGPGDPGTYAAAVKASRPWYKKKRWWLAIAVIVLIAGSALGGGGGAGDDSPAASETNKSSDGQSNRDADTDDADAKAKADAEAENKADADAEAKAVAKAKAAKAKAAAAAAVPVKAADIVKEFEDNELAADTKYKGKTLKITGVVSKIDTELFNDKKYILQLGDGGDFEFLTVNCHDMSNDELSTLGKGKSVVVIGKFDDGGDLGVEVEDCKLA